MTDAGLGGQLLVEPRTYTLGDGYNDHTVNFDLIVPRARTATAQLRLQTLYTDPDTSTFVPDGGQPTITESTWVRFSARQRSALGWPGRGTLGNALTMYLWDYQQPNARPAFFFDDSNGVPALRVHQFGDVADSRPVLVGVRLKEPDNDPGDTTLTAVRTLQLIRGAPVACGSLESSVTWQWSDQYLSASCSSRGPNFQYSWQTDGLGAWTPYSADTLLDFAGHAVTGAHTVTLRVKNLTNGATSDQFFPVAVNSSRVTLTGRTQVTDKANNPYLSNHVGWWFERWNPDVQWQTASYYALDSTTRIWPAGHYTVELRQSDSSGGVIRRGRLHITVCNPPLPSCSDQAPVSRAGVAQAQAAGVAWGLFGGGPWLTWGGSAVPRAVRFYDLLGMHDLVNVFTSTNWLDSTGFQQAVSSAPWDLHWQRHQLALLDVLAFDFSTTGSQTIPYVFGLALDPDLGANAADDAAGFDARRGLTYVYDDNGAVGYLLRNPGGSDALVGVQQFGVARHPPVSMAETWSAQRFSGVRLLPGRSDVQLVLSAAERTDAGAWTLLILRASNVTELRARADTALARLIGS